MTKMMKQTLEGKTQRRVPLCSWTNAMHGSRSIIHHRTPLALYSLIYSETQMITTTFLEFNGCAQACGSRTNTSRYCGYSCKVSHTPL